MADIDRVCVELFPLSGTRRPIMDGLERFLRRLLGRKHNTGDGLHLEHDTPGAQRS
jgi:hypothetical protein